MKLIVRYACQLVCVFMVGMICLQASVSFAAGMITVSGTHFMRDGDIFKVKGMNYYPKDWAWKMWENYSSITSQIDQELNKAQNLGVNTVRIFIPYNITAAHLNAVQDFINNKLQSRRMVALVTLFDFYRANSSAPYETSDYINGHAHIDAIVNKLGNTNPTILAWDIKNEPDSDYGCPSEAKVKAWLKDMRDYLKNIKDPNHPITIGFNGAFVLNGCNPPTPGSFKPEIPGSSDMVAIVDFISFHWNGLSEGDFNSKLGELKTRVGNKPIVLEEFALHTCKDCTDSHTEADQAAYYNAVLFLSETNDLAGNLFWTLNDFSYVIDPTATKEHCMGILRNSGTGTICEAKNPIDYIEKPAANIIRRHYNSQITVIDEANGWANSDPVDAPPPGWADNFVYSPKAGAILRGYNPTHILWSHTIGNMAFSQWTNVTNQIGLATSPMLKNVNIYHYPILQIRIANYSIRDTQYGSNATLHVGVKKEGSSAPIWLLEVSPTTPLPATLSVSLPQALDCTFNCTTRSFQIALELVPETGRNGYSATYEIDWIAITTCPDCSYLLWTK